MCRSRSKLIDRMSAQLHVDGATFGCSSSPRWRSSLISLQTRPGVRSGGTARVTAAPRCVLPTSPMASDRVRRASRACTCLGPTRLFRRPRRSRMVRQRRLMAQRGSRSWSWTRPWRGSGTSTSRASGSPRARCSCSSPTPFASGARGTRCA